MAAGPLWSAREVPTELAATRPDPEGEPTEVSIGGYLIDLQSINDSDQSFHADIFLSVSWQDTRLVSDSLASPLVGCNLLLDSVWNPRVIFVNERSVSRRLDEKVTVAPDGTVQYLQRLQGEFTTPLDLRDFPFDDHELKLDIVARGYFPEQVVFIPEGGEGHLADLTITDWEVGAAYAVVEPRYIDPRDYYIASITFYLPVKRRLGFYFMKTFLPLTLIVWMSWAVFWIKPGLLPPQIGVATSAILTLIAFQFSLSYMLPRLSYLTRADRFLIGSTLLVFLAFGEALWTSYLASHEEEERALVIDRRSRVLFPIGFGLVLLISFVV
jgi:hypothetical protein